MSTELSEYVTSLFRRHGVPLIPRADAWALLLNDVDHDLTEAALLAVLATDEQPPTPAAVRKAAARLAGLLAPTWAQALDQINSLHRWERSSRFPLWAKGESETTPARPEVHPLVDQVLGLPGRSLELHQQLRVELRSLYADLAGSHDLAVLELGGLRGARLPACVPAAMGMPVGNGSGSR